MKDQIIKEIAKELQNEGFQGTITSDTLIESLEVDSLSLYNMLAGVEDKYNVMVPCGDFTTSQTVGELADMIEKRLEVERQKAA